MSSNGPAATKRADQAGNYRRTGRAAGTPFAMRDGASPERARREYERSELERGLVARLRNVLVRARAFRTRWDERIELQRRVRHLETANPDLVQVGYTRLLGYLIAGFWGVMAALLVELFLGAPAAEFLASLAFGRGAVAEWARIVVPLAIVLLELLVASQIQLAQMEARSDPLASASGARVWKLWGSLIAVAMPALTVATLWTATDPNEGVGAFSLVLLAVCLIGLIAHIGIVFGGEAAHRARAYVFYRLRHDSLSGRLRGARRREEQARDQVRDAFRLYDDAYYEYQTTIGSPPRGAHLHPAERALVMEAVRQDLPPDLDLGSAADSPAGEFARADEWDGSRDGPGGDDSREVGSPSEDGPAPASRAAGDGVEREHDEPAQNGELDYYRSVLSQRVRDADGVLTPWPRTEVQQDTGEFDGGLR